MSRNGIKNYTPPPLQTFTPQQAEAVAKTALAAVSSALDSSSRAGRRLAFGRPGAGSLLPLAPHAGVSNDVVDLLRLLGAVQGGNFGSPGAAVATARRRFSADLPFVASKLLDLAQSGDPAAAGLAGSLLDPLARSYDLWASQFNPLMSRGSVQRFVEDLVGNKLGANPLLRGLSGQLGGTFDGVMKDVKEHVQTLAVLQSSGLSGLFSPDALGTALSKQFGSFPQDFSPFRTLSRDVREQIGEWANAVPQTLNDLRGLTDGLQGELRSLERRGMRTLEDIEGFLDDPFAKAENLFGQGLSGLERQGQRLVSEVEDMARDPLKGLAQVLPSGVELAHGRAETSATAFQAAGSVGDPNGPVYAAGQVVAGQVSASAEGRVTADLSKLTLVAEGRAEASATAFAAQGAFRLGNSDYLNVSGSGEIYVGASASGQARLVLSPDDIRAEVAGQAFAGARAQGQVSATVGPLSGSAQGEAMAGATAAGRAGIAFSPKTGNIGVEASGEAYVGASARGEIRGSAGPVAGGIGGAAMVGVGVNAGIKAGLRDGKLSFGLDLGLALGIGLRIKLDFAIDFKAIGKAISDAVKFLKQIPGVKHIVEGVGTAVKWVGNAAKEIGKGIGKAAKAVGNVAKDIGKGIGKAAKSVGKAVKKFFKGW